MKICDEHIPAPTRTVRERGRFRWAEREIDGEREREKEREREREIEREKRREIKIMDRKRKIVKFDQRLFATHPHVARYILFETRRCDEKDDNDSLQRFGVLHLLQREK